MLIRGLPNNMELDGELWGGRQKFQYTLNVVRGGPSDWWKDIKYCVIPSFSRLLGEFVVYLEEKNYQNGSGSTGQAPRIAPVRHGLPKKAGKNGC